MNTFWQVLKSVLVEIAIAAIIIGLACAFKYAPVVTLAVVVPLLPPVILIGYYIFLKMVDANFIWTKVGSGWRKISTRWGKYRKMLEPGLRLIGIPGMDTLYERKMTFLKSVTKEDGSVIAEPHNDEGVSAFKTTRFPYALPYKDEEDRRGLHLSGLMTAFGVVEDYEIAFFEVSDWYAELNIRILSPWREFLTTVSYDDDILNPDEKQEKRRRKAIGQRFWRILNAPGPRNGPSILKKVRAEVGIRVEMVELPSIDPPPGWRDTTLAAYKAKKEKEAAVLQGEASAALLDDTNQALQKYVEGFEKNGRKPTEAEIKGKQEELALRSAPNFQKIRIEGLENASTAVVGGGAGLMIGTQAGGGQQNLDNPGAKRGRQKKTQKELADQFFDDYGAYPDWDPEHRTPVYKK